MSLSLSLSLSVSLSLRTRLAAEPFRPRTLAATAAMLAVWALPWLAGRTRRDVAVNEHWHVRILTLHGRLNLLSRLARLSLRTLPPLLPLVPRLAMRARRTRLARHAGLRLLPRPLRPTVLVPAAIGLAAALAGLPRRAALHFETGGLHHRRDFRRFKFERIRALHHRRHRQRSVARADEARHREPECLE